jgi:citrate lyase beta subunit
MNPLRLGASLYVPATRPDLVEMGNGPRHRCLRSVIYCTEDSVHRDHVDLALRNLRAALLRLVPGESRPLRFIRPRGPQVLEALLAMQGIDNVDGFVLPKATCSNLPAYLKLLAGRESFWIMPTLETAEVFDPGQMRALRRLLCRDGIRQRTLSLRIGGNDLLRILGVRRTARRTIYDTAVGPWISMLAGTFRPYGFNLTGPVFEGLEHPAVLCEEVERDLEQGLFGKTAVHPDQVVLIEAMYAVSPEDLAMAERLLAADAPAVFRMYGRMCEKATHASWARQILERAEHYGMTGSAPRLVAAARSLR